MFNRRGTLLAVGCNDGRIAIWDFLTRGIAKSFSGHTHPITSLSWSRCGQKLLSSSIDWNVCVWDVLSVECAHKIRFSSLVLKTQFNPRNSSIFLVCTTKQQPCLVSLHGNDKEPTIKAIPTDKEPEVSIIGSFDRRGEKIVTGSSKGKILIINQADLSILKAFRIGVTTVRSVEFARRGHKMLINSSDRIIRVFDMEKILSPETPGDPEPLQKLQDTVNRTQWKQCCFSGDCEYIVAGSYNQHSLYIWDQSNWSLVKILTGQKGEALLDVAWHPVRPIIASVAQGVVNIWSQPLVENWSAYAPDFKELEENEEYEERESEFDIEDEDKSITDRGDEDNDLDHLVDVTAVPVIPAFCSSDEEYEEDHLDWVPIAPEVEDPEEPGWGQLEPSLNSYLVDSVNGKMSISVQHTEEKGRAQNGSPQVESEVGGDNLVESEVGEDENIESRIVGSVVEEGERSINRPKQFGKEGTSPSKKEGTPPSKKLKTDRTES
jgi:COMPASS component SWD1